MEKIRKVLDSTGLDYDVIFVDDKSMDNTAELIRRVVKANKRFKAVFHEKNVGRGGSVTDGIMVSGARVVGYLDIDLEVSPVYIPEVLSAIEGGSDVVCGKRYPDASVNNFFRNLLHSIYAGLARAILGLRVSDPNAGFKFFRRGKILPVLGKVVDRHWFWDTEVMKRADLAGLSIIEVPVLYVPNREKKSSVRVFSDTIHFITRLLWLRARLWGERE